MKERGLVTSGKKADLVARLEEAMDEELLGEDDEIPQTMTEATEPIEDADADTEVDAAVVAAPEDVIAPAPEIAEDVTKVEEPASDDVIVETPLTVGMTEEEKLKARAARFGVTATTGTNAEKLKARAQRFGLPVPEDKSEVQRRLAERAKRFNLPEPADPTEETKKRKKRAERFGITASEGQSSNFEEKKKQRAQRFGNKTSAEEEEKRKKRLQRFS